MIDIENKVIDTLAEAFTGTAKVSGAYVESPPSFPWVYARQISNTAYSRSYDNALHEHHARIAFRLEYYVSTPNGPKQDVKDLMQIGDMTMQGMKFRRTGSGVIPNFDRTVARAYADYVVLVGEPREDGNNVVYQMYR